MDFNLLFSCFLAVDKQGPASKASLSCSTLEKLRGFSCHVSSESREACLNVKMEGLGAGQLENTIREHGKMEEDAEEELVHQSKQVWDLTKTLSVLIDKIRRYKFIFLRLKVGWLEYDLKTLSLLLPFDFMFGGNLTSPSHCCLFLMSSSGS